MLELQNQVWEKFDEVNCPIIEEDGDWDGRDILVIIICITKWVRLLESP